MAPLPSARHNCSDLPLPNRAGNKACSVAVTVSTSSGQAPASVSSAVQFMAPPMPVTTGPYTVGPLYPTSIVLNGSASSCLNAQCTYQAREPARPVRMQRQH